SFADVVANAAGAPGWCGLAADRTVLWGPAGRAPVVEPADADRLRVTMDGRDLLGSPLVVDALDRVEGFVEAAPDGGLRGWAWRPANPDADPMPRLRPARGPDANIVTDDMDMPPGGGLLARRRRFAISAKALSGLTGPFRVLGGDHRDLVGSPIHPDGESRPVPPPIAGARRQTGTDVIIAVHGAPAATLACIASVMASRPRPARLIVVDDATPEPDLARALDALFARGRIALIRNPTPLGFPGAANAGLRMAASVGRDAVLLNSDTLVPRGWLEALRACAHGAPDIGTVTPLSNSAGIVSYPGPDGTNPTPDLAETRRLAGLARRANTGTVVDIPVGVGFCLYIRGDCLRATGLLRADLFAQGYGEENDFCLRARDLGWRHVAAPGVFVTHIGGQSFGTAGGALRARNAEILERLHSGYDALIARHVVADPLAPARRRIDRIGFRAARAPGTVGAVLMVTHDQGGGVERVIAARAAALRAANLRPLVLRPARLADGRTAARVAEAEDDAAFPNLTFAVPGELADLKRLLAGARVAHVELHHSLGHAPEVLDLARALNVPHEVHVHDYAWLCPRVVLLGAAGRYCGEPGIAGCVACVADVGSLLDETIGPAALRARSAHLLAGARRVVVPSADAAARIARHFPGAVPRITPHEDDGALPPVPPTRLGRCRVAVIGAVGTAKGYEILLACARDAARRALPLAFTVVGHTIDDARLMSTGHVFVTGPYAPDEAEALIRAQDAASAFIPSVVPETWCFALTEAWRAGLRAAAFDLGAQAERIRATGWGFLLPLRTPAASINDALLAACGVSRHEDSLQASTSTGP
ncbi:MAG: glycosyltransferase, partial [Acetobacteraceae bacterium]